MTSTQPNTPPDRSKIITFLGKAVEEMRATMIDRMISKDPTLCLEVIPFMGRNVPFAMACINQGYLPGVEASLSAGVTSMRSFQPATRPAPPGSPCWRHR